MRRGDRYEKDRVELSNERLITPSGLTLVGAMLGKSGLVKRCNQMSVTDKRSQPQIKNGDILLTYIGVLCQGKTAYESVREMEDDPGYYRMALGISDFCFSLADSGFSLRLN